MKNLFVLAILIPATALAGEVEIVDASALPSASGWTFRVTLRHGDEGWDHYADAWEVRGLDGAVFGTRTLFHPHENEQPFTRSLSGVVIPEGVTVVTIHAHDKVHGWSPDATTVALPD